MHGTICSRSTWAAQGDVCGILTNDTDMVMMRGLEVFPCGFFDREAKLGIRMPIKYMISSVNQ